VTGSYSLFLSLARVVPGLAGSSLKAGAARSPPPPWNERRAECCGHVCTLEGEDDTDKNNPTVKMRFADGFFSWLENGILMDLGRRMMNNSPRVLVISLLLRRDCSNPTLSFS